EAGYLVGRDAGNLILATPTAVFEGDIEAEIVDDMRETEARPSTVTDAYKLTQDTAPLEGGLIVGTYNSNNSAVYLPATSQIVIDSVPAVAGTLGVNDPISADRIGTTYLDTRIVDGLGLLTLAAGAAGTSATGSIAISAPVTLVPGAQVTLNAPDI